MTELIKFIEGLPKVELHLHIEGSLEPEMLFDLAKRNNLDLPFKSIEEVREAYKFTNLQDFLDIYYQGMRVLKTEQDFYDLTYAYLKRSSLDNVLHTEIFFDPQGHTVRGVEFEAVLNGITHALNDGYDNLGISSNIIMCFLRHLSEEDAFKTLEMALPHKDKIIGVGLDSSEIGHPPSKFERVFSKAREEGFLALAHAGEEGPPEYIWEALNILKIDRLDHGNRALEDEALVQKLVQMDIALTVCPLSNLKLCVVKNLREHPLKIMLNKGLRATVNSDDPSYFGGYMNDNLISITKELDLAKDDLVVLVQNSIDASFLGESQKSNLTKKLNQYAGIAAT